MVGAGRESHLGAAFPMPMVHLTAKATFWWWDGCVPECSIPDLIKTGTPEVEKRLNTMARFCVFNTPPLCRASAKLKSAGRVVFLFVGKGYADVEA